MELDQLLACLPRVDPDSRPPIVGHLPAFRYIEESLSSFVAPIFEESAGIEPGQTSVVLISAPAAVGKSTTAAEISRRIGAPFWDLSQVNVGDQTYVGTLATAFGPVALGDVLRSLDEGDLCLIVDALDEAELRAGSNNFEAFLEDLAKVAERPRSRPFLVLLARAETAELVSIFLEEHSVPFARFQIEFFGRDTALEFIDKRLDVMFTETGKPHGHRGNRGPFEVARDAIISRLFGLLGVESDDQGWSDERVKTFIGYAPVLEAISTFLFVPNYHDLANQLSGVAAPHPERAGAVWTFLGEIVNHILDREQRKVIGNIEEQLEPLAETIGWSEWSTLYSRDEQCLRVLCASLTRLDLDAAAGVPSELKGQYEEAIHPSLIQHPFKGDGRGGFANAVFEDFTYAWALVAGPDELRPLVRDRLTGAEYLPTPLLARFLLMLSRDDEPTVPAVDFGIIYEALRSEERSEGDVQVSLQEEDHGAVVLAEVAPAVGRGDGIAFRVERDGQGLTFTRRVAYVVADIPSVRVSLGAEGGAFVLGPSVDLRCGSLRVPAATVRVQLGKENNSEAGDVFIEAQSYEAGGGPPSVITYGTGRLGVRWQPLMYPWIEYAYDNPKDDDADPAELRAAYQFLCRILKWFHGGGYGGLTRSRKLIENTSVTGDARMAIALRQFLLERGVLSLDHGLYRLNLGQVSDLGINWNDIRRRAATEPVRHFLTEFLATYDE